jgi:hypothetical protein
MVVSLDNVAVGLDMAVVLVRIWPQAPRKGISMARIGESASNVLGILIVSDDGLTIGVANLGVGLVAVGVRPWAPGQGLAGDK